MSVYVCFDCVFVGFIRLIKSLSLHVLFFICPPIIFHYYDSVQAYTMSDSVFWTLDRVNYARMELHEPSLCLLIQHSLLKSLAIASTCALYAQHPTAAYTNSASLY